MQQQPEADVCLGTKVTPLFPQIQFLRLSKQCFLVLLIATDWVGHHSLNLTPPPHSSVPINYNKVCNDWHPRLAKGRKKKPPIHWIQNN